MRGLITMSKTKKTKSTFTWQADMLRMLRDAVIVATVASAIGLSVNLVHPEAIPFVATEEYEILVPCPEPGGAVIALKANSPNLQAKDTFFVDARPSDEWRAWHFGHATNVTYDYLDPTPEDEIEKIAKAIAKSRAKRVVVYGDGNNPDTGQQLGIEISGHGIKNVHYLVGGAPALRRSTPYQTTRGGGQ